MVWKLWKKWLLVKRDVPWQSCWMLKNDLCLNSIEIILSSTTEFLKNLKMLYLWFDRYKPHSCDYILPVLDQLETRNQNGFQKGKKSATYRSVANSI